MVLPVNIEPMKIKVGPFNILPAMAGAYKLMPVSWAHKAYVKQNAPDPSKLTRDLHDLTGESPYTMEEVVPGRLWEVTYLTENMAMTDKKTKDGMKVLGIDPTSEEFKEKALAGAASHGPAAEELCKQDLVTALEWYNKTSLTPEEERLAFSDKKRMYVVRLATGELLVYNAIRVREEHGFKAWLDGLGRVVWVVIGSCFHTSFLPHIFKLYPDAKIVGTTAAQEKLKGAQALPRGLDTLDYNLDIPEQETSAASELGSHGIKMAYIKGDVCTNAICVTVDNKVMLSVDLIYGGADGHKMFGMKREEWMKGGVEDHGLRLFRFRLMSKPNSPNGALPPYRFHMMDPDSLGATMWDMPASDGSSLKQMASCLRKMLGMDFEMALDIHCGAKMEREEFRSDIQANWGWLDGGALL